MVVGGIAVLALVRPWRPDPEDHAEPAAARAKPAPSPKRRPRPGPRSSQGKTRSVAHDEDRTEVLVAVGAGQPRRHRVEAISRGRRVPPEPGREEIVLPEWLGPVSGPR